MMRILAFVAALAVAGTASSYADETIKSGHVLGNSTSAERKPTDTPLLGVMQQPGSGLGSGVGTAAGNATNSAGGLATVNGAPVYGNCLAWSSTGISDSGGICTSVANTAAIQALTPVVGNVVHRNGFSTAGDGGDATYVYSATNCSIASGAGDFGVQIKPTSTGGCWNIVANTGIYSMALYGGGASASCATNQSALASAWNAAEVLKGDVFVPVGDIQSNAVALPVAGYENLVPVIRGAGFYKSILDFSTCVTSGVSLQISDATSGSSWFGGGINGVWFKDAHAGPTLMLGQASLVDASNDFRCDNSYISNVYAGAGGVAWQKNFVVNGTSTNCTVNGYATQPTVQSTTSTTSNSLTAGSHTFTTGTTLGWSAGTNVLAIDAANPMHFMEGTVTSNSGTTLVVNVAYPYNTGIYGTGPLTSWFIYGGGTFYGTGILCYECIGNVAVGGSIGNAQFGLNYAGSASQYNDTYNGVDLENVHVGAVANDVNAGLITFNQMWGGLWDQFAFQAINSTAGAGSFQCNQCNFGLGAWLDPTNQNGILFKDGNAVTLFNLAASTTAMVNGTGHDLLATLTGGTMTTVNNTSNIFSASSGTFPLKAGNSLTLTYSASPTLVLTPLR